MNTFQYINQVLNFAQSENVQNVLVINGGTTYLYSTSAYKIHTMLNSTAATCFCTSNSMFDVLLLQSDEKKDIDEMLSFLPDNTKVIVAEGQELTGVVTRKNSVSVYDLFPHTLH